MSGINRLKFTISTDTGGDFSETSGPCAGGLVMQIRHARTNLDTGCRFRLEAVDAAGTSPFMIADFANSGGSSWTRIPRIATYDTGGTEIGDSYPIVVPGDRLKLTVNQGAGDTGGKTGTVYVWTGW